MKWLVSVSVPEDEYDDRNIISVDVCVYYSVCLPILNNQEALFLIIIVFKKVLHIIQVTMHAKITWETQRRIEEAILGIIFLLTLLYITTIKHAFLLDSVIFISLCHFYLLPR